MFRVGLVNYEKDKIQGVMSILILASSIDEALAICESRNPGYVVSWVQLED